jgi:hypothetical protein
MVARGGSPFRSANAGELSREAGGRPDLKQYYSGGLRYKNIEPVPISGFRRMAGSLDNGEVRGRVAVMSLSAVTVTPGPFAVTTVIWQATLAGRVAAIDFDALLASVGEHEVQAEVLVSGTWKPFGAMVTAGTAARKISVAVAPGAAVLCTGVRIKGYFVSSATIGLGGVTVLTETTPQDAPRYSSVRHDSGSRYLFSAQVQFMDVFEDDVFMAGVYLPELSAAVLPNLNFYAENATVGLAEKTLQTLRARRGGSSFEWVRDLWPYSGIPTVDLGGTYAKTDDKWEVQVKWSGTPFVYITLSVDGETTTGIPFVDAGGTPVAIASSDNTKTALNIKTALEGLPSLGGTITVAIVTLSGSSKRIDLTFGGNLSGDEYQVNTDVTNTTEAAALSYHVQSGKTDFEPLISSTRGWPGVFGFVQDRLAYGDIAAVPPASAMSAAGDYFNLNIEAAGNGAARLDKLRAGQVSERVLAYAESTYALVFTDKAVHFASNRTITKNDPLNFVRTSTAGIPPNCAPCNLENKIYYPGLDPKSDPPSAHQVLSLTYSEIGTSFDATPEHILASHLIDGVIRSCGQTASSKSDAARMWMLREDGRVVVGNVIQSQDVLGYCEWVVAADGAAVELHVDAANEVRLAVRRNGRLRHERLDRATFFQAAITRTADLAGVVRELEHLEGQEVWAKVDGYVLGPFTVVAGSLALGDSYGSPVEIGLWQAPVFECMPKWYINRNDEVIERPGRIHSAHVRVLDTQSLAIGANGQPPRDVPLADAGDPVDAPMPVKTKTVSVSGLEGHVVGTTLVITQVKPGELQVRDYSTEEKL